MVSAYIFLPVIMLFIKRKREGKGIAFIVNSGVFKCKILLMYTHVHSRHYGAFIFNQGYSRDHPKVFLSLRDL